MPKKIEFTPPREPTEKMQLQRDAAHRRMATDIDTRFNDTDSYTDSAFDALKKAIEQIGGVVTLPERS